MQTIIRLIRRVVLTLLVLASCAASTPAQEVSIPDPGLNATIRAALQNPFGPLTEQDMLWAVSPCLTERCPSERSREFLPPLQHDRRENATPDSADTSPAAAGSSPAQIGSDTPSKIEMRPSVWPLHEIACEVPRSLARFINQGWRDAIG